jgi:hypothetical protein
MATWWSNVRRSDRHDGSATLATLAGLGTLERDRGARRWSDQHYLPINLREGTDDARLASELVLSREF